jgi:hypothetical protein
MYEEDWYKPLWTVISIALELSAQEISTINPRHKKSPHLPPPFPPSSFPPSPFPPPPPTHSGESHPTIEKRQKKKIAISSKMKQW